MSSPPPVNRTDESRNARSASQREPRPVAVALEGRSSELPKIVATGYGEVARQILDIAFANGIRVREDADLATILAALDIGEDVPLEALHAVSELLARVYAANGEPPLNRPADSPPARGEQQKTSSQTGYPHLLSNTTQGINTLPPHNEEKPPES